MKVRTTRVVSDRNPDIMNCYVEYGKSMKELGAVSTDDPWMLLGQEPFSISDLVASTCHELPLVSQVFFSFRDFPECFLDLVSFGCATTSRSVLSRLFGHNSVCFIT